MDFKRLRGCGRIFEFPAGVLDPVQQDRAYVRLRGGMHGLTVSNPPHIIVDASRRFAVYADVFIHVPSGQQGISGPKEQDRMLRALALYLNRHLLAYQVRAQRSRYRPRRPRRRGGGEDKRGTGVCVSTTGVRPKGLTPRHCGPTAKTKCSPHRKVGSACKPDRLAMAGAADAVRPRLQLRVSHSRHGTVLPDGCNAQPDGRASCAEKPRSNLGSGTWDGVRRKGWSKRKRFNEWDGASGLGFNGRTRA